MSYKSNLSELEDGEIDSNASLDDIYTPLERPVRNNPVPPPETCESDVDENNDSPSDSDSAGEGGSKSKIKKTNKSTKSKTRKQNFNKLQIWCNVLEVDSLSNNLNDCNLDEAQLRNRGLMPYSTNFNHTDFTRGNWKSNAGKRNQAGQFINEKKCFKDLRFTSKKGTPKFIPTLSDTAKNSNESLAREIADNLDEEKRDLILKYIEIVGRKPVISAFQETRKVEKSGGMLVMNASRRRTSGGVFFYLLKSSVEITHDQLKEIFLADKQIMAAQKKAAKQNNSSTNTTETKNGDADDIAV